ncbi:MAG: DNA polymerase II [Methanoculleus sp. SDB]|nr:MAG: DNA polymerase II [Methanoculleus sp. SDB]
MLGDREIVRRFLDTNLQVHPDVVKYLKDQQNPGLIDEIIAGVPAHTIVVGPRHVPGWKTEKDGTRFLGDPYVEIISGNAVPNGKGVEFLDFNHYFRDRYSRLSTILRNRVSAMPIEALTKNSRYRQEDTAIIGMVAGVRTTARGHRMATLEDATGTINVLFNRDREIFAEAEKIIPDEVIGINGTLSSDGTLFFAETLVRPDIPMNNAPFKSDRPGRAVLISDVHVGSDTFLAEAWDRFSSWLSTANVQYLLIAGDIVDGIGIYPGQEQELTIPNIYDQYDAFAEMLRRLPSHLQIIVSPGNHDVVRGSEPQPALPAAFTAKFPDNVIQVENPALVGVQGVRVLMYHGRSYDDLISMIPGASYTDPAAMMEEMLRRRHLACTYGMRTPIMAAKKDRLLIDPVPEILHTGHVHICGIRRYRNVLCVNSGTWQAQTKFQKQMNITPTPARATVVDLQTLDVEIFDFNA